MRLSRLAAAVALSAAALTAAPAQAARPLAVADVSTATEQRFRQIGGEFTETIAVPPAAAPSNAAPRMVVISNLSTDGGAFHTYTLARQPIGSTSTPTPYVYTPAPGVNVTTFERFELPKGGSIAVPHQPGFTYQLSKLSSNGLVRLVATYSVVENALL